MLNNLFGKDKPVKIRFYFDKEQKRMTWGDLNTIEMMQDGKVSSVRVMALAARFMADENNQYLQHEKAIKILEGLNEVDIAAVLKQFTDALQGAAVPNASGNPSTSPSAVGQVTDSPAGSQP